MSSPSTSENKKNIKSNKLTDMDTSSSNVEKVASDAGQEQLLDIVLKQNAQMEDAIRLLTAELEDATTGILMRGSLFKWRDRTISFASSWGLRYFVLQGSILSYYGDESDRHPRKTVDLMDCIILDEGRTKNDKHHIFSVVLKSAVDASRGPQSGALIRMSSDSEPEAQQWIRMLGKACGLKLSPPLDQSGLAGLVPEMNEKNVPQPVLARVRSSGKLLQTLQQRDSPRNSASNLQALASPIASGKTLGEENVITLQPKCRSKKTLQQRGNAFPASKAIHVKTQPSPLSIHAKQQNYRGFFNLGVIILMMSHFRVIMDNILEYGLFLSSYTSGGSNKHNWDLPRPLHVTASWMLFILVVFGVEKLAEKGHISDRITMVIQGLISTGSIIASCLWVWYSKSHPGLCMLYLLQSVIIWMKLISYVHCNRDLRIATRERKTADKCGKARDDNNAKPVDAGCVKGFSETQDLELPILSYPQNLTLSNLLYFCVVPTLCYQMNYPRCREIRPQYIVTIVVRMIVTLAMIMFVVTNHISPGLEAAMQPIQDLDILGVIQRLIHISIPNTYVWLLGFYMVFHLWLNLLAELTRFSDRSFYSDWWNARTIDEYWRTWNLPVHHWMLRHLYYPMLRMGTSKTIAVFAAFLFSAAFHELLISIPFRKISYHAFVGMLAQAPLVTVTRKVNALFNNQIIGNVFFWLTFCIIGQPVGVILYYYEHWDAAQQH